MSHDHQVWLRDTFLKTVSVDVGGGGGVVNSSGVRSMDSMYFIFDVAVRYTEYLDNILQNVA